MTILHVRPTIQEPKKKRCKPRRHNWKFVGTVETILGKTTHEKCATCDSDRYV